MEKNNVELMKVLMPDMSRAFEGLMSAAFKDGVLSVKVKELIAIGTAVALGCNDCMDFHIAAAKKLGAGKEEIAEAMAVGFEMGSGRLYPAMMRSLSGNFGDAQGDKK